jgi:hypothetical protein
MQTAILRLPLVKRPLGDAVTAANIRRPLTRFLFLQYPDNLFFAKAAALHKSVSSLATDSTLKWRKLRGTGQFPGMRCRAIAAQFMENQIVVLFELTLQGDEIKIVEERHYRLVPAADLDQDAIRDYRD